MSIVVIRKFVIVQIYLICICDIIMMTNLVTQALHQKDFLEFALKYNKFVTNRTGKYAKYNDELWIVLENLIKYDDKIPAINYIYTQEDYTSIIIETLKNYQSEDMLLRILKVGALDSVIHQLWLVSIYYNPEDFTAEFSYNFLHGLKSLEQIWKDQSKIIGERIERSDAMCLWVLYQVNRKDGSLHIVVQVWHVESDDKKLTFFSSETIYKIKLDIQATLDYINYKYPDKNLFEVFSVDFYELLSNHV